MEAFDVAGCGAGVMEGQVNLTPRCRNRNARLTQRVTTFGGNGLHLCKAGRMLSMNASMKRRSRYEWVAEPLPSMNEIRRLQRGRKLRGA